MVEISRKGGGVVFNGLHNDNVGKKNIFCMVTSRLQYQITTPLLEEQWFLFPKENTRADLGV